MSSSLNKDIINNCNTIVSYNLSWNEAKSKFNISDPDLQRIYIRYIICLHGFKKAKKLLAYD
uniref:Pichia acaciae plasmid pPac1-1 n=1 Tax=Millerozyma acaciae TaxID=28986 RepID=Q2P9T3_9ASCO|nr:unnamed protein product [Millerozyma acaciae]